MDQSKINVRYAKAFFTLVKEKGLTSELRQDTGLIASLCTASSDFNLMLASPVIRTSDKVKAIKSIFNTKVHELSLNFLLLITENKRENNIAGIFRILEDLYSQEEGIKTAVLTSAQPLDEELVLQVKKMLETKLNSKVEINQKVDASLIGGFVLRFDNKQYDASISTQLKKIREHLFLTELK